MTPDRPTTPRYVHIYADADGESHLADIEMPMTDLPQTIHGNSGRRSDPISSETLTIVSFEGPTPKPIFAPPPDARIGIVLRGELVLETSDGAVTRLGAGDMYLVEDTHGKGHRNYVVAHEVVLMALIKISPRG